MVIKNRNRQRHKQRCGIDIGTLESEVGSLNNEPGNLILSTLRVQRQTIDHKIMR